MKNYKATPEQWEASERRAANGNITDIRLLELRARVEALEAQASNYLEIPDSSTPPPVATDEELDKTWNSEYTAEGNLRAVYNLGAAHGQAGSREAAELRAELERERIRLAACGVVAKADTPESAKEARDMHPHYHSASLDDVISMVDALMAERAKQAHSREVAEPAPVAGGLVARVSRLIGMGEGGDWSPEARVAILEVAASALQMHPDKNLTWERVSLWLEQEAGR